VALRRANTAGSAQPAGTHQACNGRDAATARHYKSGPIYEEIWNRLIEPEKKGDPEKKGFGVLINVERAEDLTGAALAM
jgi:hypothetical protein